MKIDDGFVAVRTSEYARTPVSSSMFAHRADEILNLVTHLRAELGLHEALNVAIERFVDDEPHPEMKRFGEVVVLARRQALLQERLDDDREQLHSGVLNHEEREITGHHYEMLRHEACRYNHLMRGLIENCGHYFSREQLMRWLTAMSQGRSQWARGEVTGAVSELALHAALQGLPELRDLRYATIEEDLAGYDFVASWQGRLLTVDAKTGFYRPLTERKHGHKHLEISVPREAVKEFWVTRRGLDVLRHEVRQALQSSESVEHHAPHHYYKYA
ncbi:MAG TPA: hypothetical protein VGH44_04380 [Candidatus Saccharimonadia bacterium]|jgi:hypothetical protein